MTVEYSGPTALKKIINKLELPIFDRTTCLELYVGNIDEGETSDVLRILPEFAFLRQLELRVFNMNEQQRLELQQSLPNCEIVFIP